MNDTALQKPRFLRFKQYGDERGYMVVVEGNGDIPFVPKRIFYIYGTEEDVVRGQHANRESEFVLINVAGKSKVRTMDLHGNEEFFTLDEPHTGIYIPKMVWKDMYDFSDDSVLLVLASTHFDNTEYIRDYEQYKELMAESDS